MTVDPRATAMTVRLWLACLATQELLTTYLGVRLGLYDALAEGPATVDQLAVRATLAPRYAREWLEQQAVAGFIEVDDVAKPAADRVYSLPAGHARVLTISDDPMSLASLAVLPLGGVAGALPALLDAYQTGAGVPDTGYGEDWRLGHSGANRALFTHQLAGWLEQALPQLHTRLLAPGARIADIGCGAGWSSIALAKAYPDARIDGFDLEPASVADASRHAAVAGVADRVSVAVHDAAELGRDPNGAGQYDLVCLLDVLHEMARPVEVLRACRALRADAAPVLVMDAKVAPTFTAPGDEVERFQYATSVLHCLPAGLASQPSAGTGTVMRPNVVRAFAAAAGFADTRLLPVGDRFHRLYQLVG